MKKREKTVAEIRKAAQAEARRPPKEGLEITLLRVAPIISTAEGTLNGKLVKYVRYKRWEGRDEWGPWEVYDRKDAFLGYIPREHESSRILNNMAAQAEVYGYWRDPDTGRTIKATGPSTPEGRKTSSGGYRY